MSQAQRLQRVSERFTAITAAAEDDERHAIMGTALSQTKAACEEAAAHEQSGDVKQRLTDVASALQTWQDVWPRLGTQPEFRLAVSREARLWSKRFADAAKAAPSL